MAGEQVDFDAQLVAFADDLRSEGVAVGTSELLDAFLALELVAWSSPSEFRETLVLRDLQGFGYCEIAEITGSPIGTVMSRLARARQRLIAALKESNL